jgi:ATP-dependent protease ClpP protease subunit
MSLENLLLKQNNHIYVYDEITPESFKEFSLKSRYLRLYKQPETVNIYISTIGGDVDCALGIIDEINGFKTAGIKVNTIGIGRVYSSGIFILCAGDRRYGTEYTTYMIHPFRYDLGEEYHAHALEYVKYAEKLQNEIMLWVAMQCGKNQPKDIKKFMTSINDSIYLNNETAKELGLIHEDWNYANEISNKPGIRSGTK